ncbi:RluA family pseudouridine synthase [Sporolactobacillus laevolacticus]|uniref:RluA family pseudouridine synthase n=1 Tax=Sporolactobacillus laevolacticus TaxID=33018 RepID=UPI0025B42518|nr:RluA family pseudouridine synthase [Sporolactobacillus laevolacticus]MDN3954065.1 RluA family pseudouridine synthase [Sporolactobacillus laevolacticus]
MPDIVKKVEASDEGKRIDSWTSEQITSESRNRLQQLIKDGNILVNGSAVKTSYRMKEDDEVLVHLPEPEPLDVEPEDLPLDIVYEDSSVIVINKPRGMVVHPAPGHLKGTLVNALLGHCHDLSGINGIMRPGIVHRIDKETSGLLMVAKTDEAHHSLAAQLKDKTTQRLYLAIVHGILPHDEGTINAPIGRADKDRKKMAVTEKNSKHAVTHFKVLERFSRYTYVACRLETGRTHQIRVHMAYIGHPLAGDPKYGPRKTLPIQGQALHAAELGFTHPVTHQFMLFQAPLPRDMEQLLDGLRTDVFK